MKRHLLLMASLMGVGLSGQLALAEVGSSNPAPAIELENWTLHSLGLTDAEHTRPNGSLYRSIRSMNEAGDVAGISIAPGRYSTWLFDGTVVRRIGLFDKDHTNLDGEQRSDFEFLNEVGHVAGTSERYTSDPKDYLDTAWVYNGSETLRIGLADSLHTRSDGVQDSRITSLNEKGQVIGISTQYNGDDNDSSSAWLYDGNQTRRIGLFDEDHTGPDGFQGSTPLHLNNAGHVMGSSARYVGANDEGDVWSTSLWLYDGNQTRLIGLYGEEHTRSDGYQRSGRDYHGFVDKVLNDAGQAVGYSKRYRGDNDYGRSAWVYDGSQTQRIGFLDEQHTQDDGYQYSTVTCGINEAGQVAGYSIRYTGYSSKGRTAWLYQGNQIKRIGLLDKTHTKEDGTQSSEPIFLTEAGQVAGHSTQFTLTKPPQGDYGKSVWFFDGSNTRRIGFYGNGFTRNDGYQDSDLLGINKLGQVFGRSDRFSESGYQRGYVWWMYDPQTDKNYAVDPRPEAFSSAGEISIRSLSDNGILGGVYHHPTGTGGVHSRGFTFSIEGGINYISDLLNAVDYEALGLQYQYLGSVHTINGSGQIAGGSGFAYILSPKDEPVGNGFPSVAITSPTTSSKLIEGSAVTFTVDASDSDGSITKVEYYAFGDQLFATSTEAPFSITVDRAPYGTFDITAVAYDNDGNSTTSEVVTLTVNANDGGNIPPSITITSPSDNSELIEGAPVTFTVDASDADGSVTKVEYFAFGDQLFGTVTEAPFTLNVDRAPYGTFDITAVVYDDKGASTVSPAIVVNVVEPTVVVD